MARGRHPGAGAGPQRAPESGGAGPRRPPKSRAVTVEWAPPAAAQWLADIVAYLGDRDLADLAGQLQRLKEEDSAGLDAGLLPAALGMLEAEFRRLLADHSAPLAMKEPDSSTPASVVPSRIPASVVHKLGLILDRLAANGRLDRCQRRSRGGGRMGGGMDPAPPGAGEAPPGAGEGRPAACSPPAAASWDPTRDLGLRPRERPPPPRPAAAAWAAPPCPQAPPAPAGRHAALPRRRPALWPAGAPPVGQIRAQAEGSQGGGVAGGGGVPRVRRKSGAAVGGAQGQ